MANDLISRSQACEMLLKQKQLTPSVVRRVLLQVPTQEAEKNEPLTLDELRMMDGEPVFLTDLVHKSDPKGSDLWGGWNIFTRHDHNGFISRGGGFLSNDGYEKTWLAYRHPPKEA